MKYLYSLFLVLFLSIPSFAQTYVGNATLDTQAEVDSFGASGYTKINGHLTIQNTTVNDLSPLSTINEVLGTVTIKNNDSLPNLVGLHNISSVIDLYILNNNMLTSLDGLNELDSVLNIFKIMYNDSLINLNGLEDLNFVANELVINVNQSLETLEGIDNLTEMYYETGELVINYNDNLTSINSLNQLIQCGELYVHANPILTNLHAFAGLKKANTIHMILNEELISIDSAFHQLDTLEDLFFHEQNKVPSLNNFSNLKVCKDIEIEFNERLKSIDFSSITSCHSFKLLGNDSLLTMGNFDSLTDIYEFKLTGSTQLEQLPNFSVLDSITNIEMSSLSSLESLTGFENITKINFLYLRYNYGLINLNGLNNATNIHTITLNNNIVLKSLDGLGNLTVSEGISIHNNDSLSSYCALDNFMSSLDTTETFYYNVYNNLYNPLLSDLLDGDCIDCPSYTTDLSMTSTLQQVSSNQDYAAYQWLDCDNGYTPIPGDTFQTLSSTTHGNVALEINYYDCIDTTDCVPNCAAFPINLAVVDSEGVFTAVQDSATYQWLDCDNGYAVIVGDTNQSFSSTVYGNIAVEINRNGCIDTSACMINCPGYSIDLSTTSTSQQVSANLSNAEYQWLDCDNGYAIIPNDTLQTLTSSTHSNVAVEIIIDGCIDTTACITNCTMYPIDLTVTDSANIFTAIQDSATYQWLDCDNGYSPIIGETGQSFSSTTYENIAVEINRNGCVDTSDCIVNCSAIPIDLTVNQYGHLFVASQPSASFQWLDCENGYAPIVGSVGPVFSSTIYGNIAVEINRNGCLDTTDCMINCDAYPIDLTITDSGNVLTANQGSATYQWLDCDNGYSPIIGETSQSFSSTTYGNVAVEINRYGCIDTTDCITNCGAFPIDLTVTDSANVFTALQDSATYQWLDCDNGYSPITGETSQSFSSTMYGNIAVEINRNGCPDTTDCMINCGAFPINLTVNESGNVFTAIQDSATYQWLDCDNGYSPITGETGQSFSSTTYGNIAVQINRNGCVDTTDCITNCGAFPIDLTVTESGNVFTAIQDSATYQWLDCDNGYSPIEGDTNQSFSSTIYGNIAVEINRNGCTEISECITNCVVYPIDLSTSTTGQQIISNQDSASYQWLDCDNNYAPIPGKDGQVLTSVVYGNFAVEINYYGCIDTTECMTIETLNTVTIHPFDLISVHPNPVSDLTTIDFGNLKNLNIKVYNQLGQTVYQDHNISQGLYTLNTSTFASGVYLIEVYDSFTRKQLKIIKQ